MTHSCPLAPPGKTNRQGGRENRPLPRQAKDQRGGSLFPTFPTSSRVNKVIRQLGLPCPEQVQPCLAHVDRHTHTPAGTADIPHLPDTHTSRLTHPSSPPHPSPKSFRRLDPQYSPSPSGKPLPEFVACCLGPGCITGPPAKGQSISRAETLTCPLSSHQRRP